MNTIESGVTPCIECGVRLRTSGHRREDYPDTRMHAGNRRCSACRARVLGTRPAKTTRTRRPRATPCNTCAKPMRPSGTSIEDYPECPVAHRALGFCDACYARQHVSPAERLAKAKAQAKRDAARAKRAAAAAAKKAARAAEASTARARASGDFKPITIRGLDDADPGVKAAARVAARLLIARRERGAPPQGHTRPVTTR